MHSGRPRTRSARSFALVALIALAPSLAACSDDDTDTGSDTSTTVTTAAPETTTSTTTTVAEATTTAPAAGATTTTAAEPATGDLVPDGMSFGFVKEVDLGGSTITIDIAQLLTGDDAVKAAIGDGNLEPGETSIDNDYYIRNQNPKVRVAPVAADVKVKVLEDLGNPEAIDGTFEQFGANVVERAGMESGMPVQIVAAGGVVSRIDEVFFP